VRGKERSAECGVRSAECGAREGYVRYESRSICFIEIMGQSTPRPIIYVTLGTITGLQVGSVNGVINLHAPGLKNDLSRVDLESSCPWQNSKRRRNIHNS
jgi:hypothetical protein